jgi:hypothetical protein
MNDHDHLSSRVRYSHCAALLLLCLTLFTPVRANAAEVTYPQLIHIRYEAVDQRVGGHFIVWVEREKIWYGLDPRLYPAAKAVEVTHITPAPGSPVTTIIAITRLGSATPDYFHLTGNVRFRVSGMAIKSTNVP